MKEFMESSKNEWMKGRPKCEPCQGLKLPIRHLMHFATLLPSLPIQHSLKRLAAKHTHVRVVGDPFSTLVENDLRCENLFAEPCKSFIFRIVSRRSRSTAGFA
jgi:hypothetical protein